MQGFLLVLFRRIIRWGSKTSVNGFTPLLLKKFYLRMFFPRTWWRRTVFVFVGVPTVSLCGISAYVQYRKRIRPTFDISYPTYMDDGSLLLDGKIIPRPSRLKVAGRLLELIIIFLPLALLYVVMRLREEWYRRWLELLLGAVQRAGPAFVKAGQWSCTRHDIFSSAFRAVFQQLYNEVDIHSFEVSLKILREELQQDPSEIFSYIDPVPVGSGSIGQVHLATLRNTNEKVVIKVMHPDIVETIVKDMCIILNTAWLLDKCFSSLEVHGLTALAYGWSRHLVAQLDFRLEAKHLTIFRENFRHEPFVEFPKPVFSTQRVLVETFCEGEPATPEFLGRQEEHVRDILAHKGLNTWCKMVLHDHLVHGDMHPGNILMDVSDPHNPRVSLIDVGLCQKISQVEGDITHDLMESFVHWKPDLCAASILRMGTTQGFVDEKKFRTELESLFNRWRPNKNSSGAVTNILQAIFECIRENHVRMDPPYVSLLFAVLVLESFIMNLNPDFNMVRHAAPWLVSEGHISYSLVKNIFLTRLDVMKQDFSAFRSRMRDSVFDDLAHKANVRLYTSEW